MKYFVFVFVLWLVAGPALATFELQDPAEQILEEQQEPGYGEAQDPLLENDFCVFEIENDECFCIHKESNNRILLTDEECEPLVSQAEITE